MSTGGRRLSQRRTLDTPVEAELLLCGGDVVSGWILDEQDDGLGMVFGAADVPRLATHRACCVGGAVDLWLADIDSESGRHAVPVRLAHVTQRDEAGICRAGLSFDVSRMRSEDVAQLLHLWRRLMTTPVT